MKSSGGSGNDKIRLVAREQRRFSLFAGESARRTRKACGAKERRKRARKRDGDKEKRKREGWIYATTVVLDHGGVKRGTSEGERRTRVYKGRERRERERERGRDEERVSLTHVHRAPRVAALWSRRSEAAKPSGRNSRTRVVASLGSDIHARRKVPQGPRFSMKIEERAAKPTLANGTVPAESRADRRRNNAAASIVLLPSVTNNDRCKRHASRSSRDHRVHVLRHEKLPLSPASRSCVQSFAEGGNALTECSSS